PQGARGENQHHRTPYHSSLAAGPPQGETARGASHQAAGRRTVEDWSRAARCGFAAHNPLRC
ncbi:MAG: hypothetical protein Q7J02_04710, partial [Rhodocyclaceae bacterium]|nr:hypothetical protein [Rhodocyclaceae bacterium]